MSYRIERDESVEEGIRRIANEQLFKGIGEIDAADLDRHQTVHQVRKRCKKLRGLIRLTRPAFESTYQDENTVFRDAAKNLSEIRDARSIITTYDDLLDRFDDQVQRAAFGSIRRGLTCRLQEIKESAIDDALQSMRKTMCDSQRRIEDWNLSTDGFDAIQGGFAKTRERAVERMTEVLERPDTQTLHQWRKRTKYHWYHMRLLKNIWPGIVSELRDSLDQLADLLGDDHDLAVFQVSVHAKPDEFGSPADIKVLDGLIDQRRKELQCRAMRRGKYLYAESTENLADRFRRYWQLWRG